MEELLRLKQQRAEAIRKLRSLLDKAKTEKRDLSDDEDKEYKSFESQVTDLDTKIAAEEKRLQEKTEREQRLATLETTLGTVEKRIQLPNAVVMPTGNEPESGFRSFGEFLHCIASNRFDTRLQRFGDPRNRLTDIRSTQQMGVGALGGFMIPDQFRNQILSVSPQDAIVRPRATVIEAGDPPDGKLILPAIDQGASRNVYGGVVIYHQGEKSTLTETNAYLRQVTLEPKKMTGYMICTNDLLANWGAASGFCQTQMRLAMTGAEDYDFLRGDGANKAMGIINLKCAIAYSRATASQISFADITGMLARIKFGGPLVWITSQTTIPQLASIRDTGSSNLLVQNAAVNMPMTLMGYPLLFSERVPALGTKGDLMLCDISKYLVKDGSGPRVDVSTDFLFSSDQTCFRLVWHVDGQSWLNEPIPLEGSTSNTVSPFVILE